EEAAFQAELERRDELLGRAEAVVLWFEHDLFDQLQLLQVLSQLGEETEVELVQADDYLGPLDASRLEALWHARRPVDAATRAVGTATPPLPPPGGDEDAFAATPFELTPKGRELV